MRIKRWIIGLLLAIAALLVCMQTGVFSSLGSWLHRWYGAEEVPQVKEIRPIDEHGRVGDIGRLGDKAIAIPGSIAIVGWVRYMGDPNDFDFSKEAKAYRKAHRNQVGYDRPIEGFGFDMRITDGAVRQYDHPTNQAWLDDRAKHVPKFEPYPWTMVSVDAIKPGDDYQLNQNAYLASSLQDGSYAYSNYKDFGYQLQKQRVYGLSYYQANHGIDPHTDKPWVNTSFGQDIFVHRNARGDAIDVIKCDSELDRVPYCIQSFSIPEMRTWVDLHYNRHYLPQWQQMENDARRILNSWVVSPEQIRQQTQ